MRWCHTAVGLKPATNPTYSRTALRPRARTPAPPLTIENSGSVARTAIPAYSIKSAGRKIAVRSTGTHPVQSSMVFAFSTENGVVAPNDALDGAGSCEGGPGLASPRPRHGRQPRYPSRGRRPRGTTKAAAVLATFIGHGKHIREPQPWPGNYIQRDPSHIRESHSAFVMSVRAVDRIEVGEAHSHQRHVGAGDDGADQAAVAAGAPGWRGGPMMAPSTYTTARIRNGSAGSGVEGEHRAVRRHRLEPGKDAGERARHDEPGAAVAAGDGEPAQGDQRRQERPPQHRGAEQQDLRRRSCWRRSGPSVLTYMLTGRPSSSHIHGHDW